MALATAITALGLAGIALGAAGVLLGGASDAVASGLLLGAGAASALGLALLWRHARRAAALWRALETGLASLREGDFGVRLATDAAGDGAALAASFNELSRALREVRQTGQQKELLLATVLQSAPMAILLLDQRERAVLDNRAARELLGGGRSLVGRRIADLVAELPPALGAALAAGGEGLLALDVDGERETFHLSQRAFTLDTRRHRLVVLEHMTRELRRQEVAVWKKVIRVISHEIDNSLAPVLSLLGSTRRILANPAHHHRLGGVLDTVEGRVTHLSGFLKGYARFARLPAPRKESVEWAPFLDDLARLCAFRLEGAPPARPGRFDPAQLQQVLINLVKNAAEAGSPPEETTVRVEPLAEGGARLRVADRGAGMTPEVLEKALLPFYSTKERGSGLGLPLCREIVEAHGGSLRLAVREGGGTVVSLTLPGA